MAKLTKTQEQEIYDVLGYLLRDDNGGAYNALSSFYVKYAPKDTK
jgi:hypothetical protein